MAKSLTIKFLIDNAQAKAANRQAMADFAAQARAAQQTATAQTVAVDRAAKATVAASARATAAQQKAADAAVKATQKAADQQTKAAQRKADQQARMDARTAVQQQRAADRATQQQQRQADQQARAAQRAADAQMRADQRAAKAKVDGAWRAFERGEKFREREATSQLRAAQAAKQAAQEQEQGTGLVDLAVGKLATSVIGLAGGYLGLQSVQKLMEDIAQSTERAYEVQKMLAEEVGNQRDAARELRSMEGKEATTQGTLEDAKFGTKTGMKMEEVLGFKAAFMGSGAQFEGKTMSPAEFAEYQQNAARLAVAKGIDPSIIGDLAGKVSGMKDYSGLGAGAGEAAFGDLNQMIAVMQRGSGNNKQLVEQLSKLSSFAFNEDEMLGAFSSHKEMASALSVAAEVSPAESEVYTRNALKAVRGFGEDDKQGPLLKRAGIDANTPFFEAFEKLTPVIEKEAKDRGLKTYDIIKENFGDEREQKAVGAYVNKGVRGNVIKDRLDFADKNAGPGPAFAEVERFEKNPDSAGVQRRAEAKKKEADMVRGAKSLQAENLYVSAEADLQSRGKIDTAESNKQDVVDNRLSIPARLFGRANPEARKARIISQALVRLEHQAAEKGVDFDPYKFYLKHGNDEDQLSTELTNEMARMSKAGVDVFGEPSGPYKGKPHEAMASGLGANTSPLERIMRDVHREIAKPAPPQPRPQARVPAKLKRP